MRLTSWDGDNAIGHRLPQEILRDRLQFAKDHAHDIFRRVRPSEVCEGDLCGGLAVGTLGIVGLRAQEAASAPYDALWIKLKTRNVADGISNAVSSLLDHRMSGREWHSQGNIAVAECYPRWNVQIPIFVRYNFDCPVPADASMEISLGVL